MCKAYFYQCSYLQAQIWPGLKIIAWQQNDRSKKSFILVLYAIIFHHHALVLIVITFTNKQQKLYTNILKKLSISNSARVVLRLWSWYVNLNCLLRIKYFFEVFVHAVSDYLKEYKSYCHWYSMKNAYDNYIKN